MRLMQRNRNPRQRGVVILEFAMVLPALLLILAATIEFGTTLYRQQILIGAAREAARAVSSASCEGPSTAEVVARVDDYLTTAGLDPTLAAVSVEGAGGEAGTSLTVDISYPANFTLTSRFAPPGTPITDLMTLHVRMDAENE